jgi:hypothetical protein
MIVVAGMLAGVMATGVGIASAQATQSGIEQKAKTGAKHVQTKWDSLTPADQQKYAADWKMTEAEAKAKWDTLTPEQQASEKQKAMAEGKKAKKKFESLPK